MVVDQIITDGELIQVAGDLDFSSATTAQQVLDAALIDHRQLADIVRFKAIIISGAGTGNFLFLETTDGTGVDFVGTGIDDVQGHVGLSSVSVQDPGAGKGPIPAGLGKPGQGYTLRANATGVVVRVSAMFRKRTIVKEV